MLIPDAQKFFDADAVHAGGTLIGVQGHNDTRSRAEDLYEILENLHVPVLGTRPV